MPRQNPGENRESLLFGCQIKYLPAEKLSPPYESPKEPKEQAKKPWTIFSADPDFKFASGSALIS
jgi:hypothetical protein